MIEVRPRNPAAALARMALPLLVLIGAGGGAWPETAGEGAKKADVPGKADAPKVGAPKTDALRTDAPKTDAPKCDRGQFRIVLDVGHSEEVPGAISARNVQEYDFNLRLAKQIEASLVADGFARTFLMVTHGPKYASLFQRVATANHHAANVFLSIHHDSVPDSYLEKWEYKGTPSHYSDRFHGHSLFVSRENLHFDASVQFGKLLGRQLKDHDLHYARQYASVYVGRNHHELVDPEVGLYRYDKLEVLRSTTMPAVLLEAGSIINRDEELRMGSREHRAVMVDAVTKAVEAYCDTHAPQIARAAKPSSKPASGAASKSGSGAPPKQASDAPPKLSGAQP